MFPNLVRDWLAGGGKSEMPTTAIDEDNDEDEGEGEDENEDRLRFRVVDRHLER